ncbi:MAG TPA: leucyl aminopeptidase [Stellaceae bacterium]|nr:leucyl aminopeptidase [Stellaceae bacterium]
MTVATASAFKTAEIVPLFRRMLDLCKLQPSESLVLLTEPETNQDYAAAFYAAARDIGAETLSLMVPSAPPEQVPVMRSGNASSTILAKSRLAIETLKRADMVVDLSSGGLLHSQEQRLILETGTRMLLVHDPVEALQRLFPTEEDKHRVTKGTTRLGAASRVRLKSDGGTNVWFEITARPVIGQYGFTDQPGRWDHWPGAFQYTIPHEGVGEGTLVLDPGDIWYPAKRFITTPVTLEFEAGAVVSITGGYDAFMVKEYIENWHDPEGFAISHIGWGSHPRALWNALAFQDPMDVIGQDGRTAYGTTLFALGENATFGGKHTVGCHQDFALRHHRFYLDDELIADSGKILPSDLQ